MGFELNQHQSYLETVKNFKKQMKDTLDEAKAALAKSKDEMAKYYDQKSVRATCKIRGEQTLKRVGM